MRVQKKLSEAEIERDLIEDAGNPDAWEAPITVGPSRSPRPSWYRQTTHDREADVLHRKQLHDAIAKLPDLERQCFQLWLDGFKYREISTVIGVTPDAVKSRVREAKTHLRSRLKEPTPRARAAGAKH
jgi:RNA polymerase sigma factor (sigma-70 family)